MGWWVLWVAVAWCVSPAQRQLGKILSLKLIKKQPGAQLVFTYSPTHGRIGIWFNKNAKGCQGLGVEGLRG